MNFENVPNLVWGLQLAIFVLLILEIVIPSGGVIIAMAFAALIWSWVEILGQDLGDITYLFLTINIIGIPITLWYSLKFLEKSSFSLASELNSSDGFHSPSQTLIDFTGQTGVVIQDLRPVGKVKIDGTELEAYSGHDWIVKGTQIVVQSCKDNKIIVKELINNQ